MSCSSFSILSRAIAFWIHARNGHSQNGRSSSISSMLQVASRSRISV